MAHDQLLTHATNVNIYRTKYQGWTKITLNYDTELNHHARLTRGSFDFIGLIKLLHFVLCPDAAESREAMPSYLTDFLAILTNFDQ
ncbi:hypothetical protein CR513_60768, partial [Mucuna pruriens]